MVTGQQRYREKVSRMISWGHWFALFNIILALLAGSRYLLVADWPGSLTGRIYAYTSWIGHFSFIVFAVYLLIIFPLTFVVMSQRLLRVLSAIIATAGLTLLLIDSVVFDRFHLHLNPIVWELVVNPVQSEMAREWQLMFICVPVIFLVEMLFATWSWQKLRSLNRRRFGKPLTMLFISAFLISHLIYIWADANFYRPVTMQRSNLPLSYPMTARKFLERHGLLDAEAYQRKLSQQGHPDASAVAYPLNDLRFREQSSGLNLLVITIDRLNQETIDSSLPSLAKFAATNAQFEHHFSAGTRDDAGLFSLFYGISASYMDGVLAAQIPSALMNALSYRGYQFGLFASDGFSSPLYRQALLTDFTLPSSVPQSNEKTTAQWQSWLNTIQSDSNPWFSYVSYESTSKGLAYQQGAQDVDRQIKHILKTLGDRALLNNTVVIITAHQRAVSQDVPSSPANRASMKVPLIVHWPGTPAQKVAKLTEHHDVMTTIMQRMLNVANPSKDYSQGEDLFLARRKSQWVSTNDGRSTIITTPGLTLQLSNNGEYKAWDNKGNVLENYKPGLALLLQVLTEEQRFIAN